MNRSLLLSLALCLSACPTPSSTDAGRTCASQGGRCDAVSACGPGAGYLGSSADCASPSSVCCLPLTACGSQAEFDCCSGSATFRPSCADGKLACLSGQTRCAVDAGTTCASVGGACTAIGSCGRGAGYLANSDDCSIAMGSTCCLPLTACGSAPEFDCCAGSATFRPNCTGGTLTCLPGHTRCGVDAGTDAG